MIAWSRFVWWLAIFVATSDRLVHAITCIGAMTALTPCLSYLPSTRPTTPSHLCFTGVSMMNGAVSTSEGLRDMCGCLKKAAISFRVKPYNAKVVPEKCDVSASVPIDPDIDSSMIVLEKDVQIGDQLMLPTAKELLSTMEDQLYHRLEMLRMWLCCAVLLLCSCCCCCYCHRRDSRAAPF